MSPSALHVPVRDDVPVGALSGAYEEFRSTEVSEWGAIRLSDTHIIGLVNVRVISQSLGLSSEHVLGQTGASVTYVALHARLNR